MMLSIGTVLSGRYEILEKIGTGGMAVVYRGTDLKLDRSVTIKVLKEEYTGDEDFKSRFKIEARAAAKLSHPNIVNVYDVGEDGNIQYIVMEYVHGDTLKQVILNSAPLDNVTTLSIAVQMVSALVHAHKKGVVHRDIKPHNILVSVDGNIKITDFGIARAAAISTVTTTTNALGSVYYFSPEQARGGYVDEKSDIYSLGITMFEMLTGKVPYDGDTSVAIALQHLNNELPDMKEYNPDVSDTIQGIVRKATQKKKDNRYANIGLLLQDLKKALAEESSNYRKKAVSEAKNELADEPEKIENNTEPEKLTLDEASAAAATVGITKAAENGVEAADEPEIKVELAKGKNNPDKEYNLPEKAVDFDMYNKKFNKLKISKGDDDEYEYDMPKRQTPRNEAPKKAYPPKQQKAQQRQRPKAGSDIDDDMDDEYYRARERKVTIAAIITALVIIAIISFVGAKVLNGGSVFGNGASVKTSELPNFENIPFEEAEKTASSMGITLNKTGEEYDDEIDEGSIISQSIAAGTSVSKGDVIDVVVSLGSKSFAMPDVIYDELETAVDKIKKQGGKEPEVKYEFDDSIPAGVVMEQEPEGQVQITSATAITLTVSKGPETDNATVPNFIGMQLEDAKKLAQQEGVVIGNVTEDTETDGVKGKVLSQSVDKGTEVERDTKIDLVVIGEKPEEPEEEPEETPEDTTGENNGSDNSEQGADSSQNTSQATGSKTFSIEAPSSYNDQQNISVKMLKITNGSSVEVVYNESKTINDFPFSVTLNGSGQEEVQLYIDNVYQWSQIVDFSAGGN